MSAAAPDRRDEPLFLGRYRPVRPLGSGGSGAVWLARDDRTGREVTIKVVPREGKAGSRARREAQAMAQLEHPSCLRAFACGRDADHVYIAYEYVPGRTFRESLREGRVNDAEAIEIAAQALDGLAHAHGRGIVHRDVKPANVLLADTGRPSVRLLDFGLARFAEADTLTAAGDVPGTLAYIAPERLHGDGASPAGDVWSVGVMLHEALAGRHPFWRPALAETAEAIAQGAPPLGELRPDLPLPLLGAVDRALSLDPTRRPSAAKLARALRKTKRGGGETLAAAQVARRLGPPALAATYAGAAAAVLPFYPVHAEAALAALVGALAYVRPRWGLAAALATPILPLGNIALALGVLYAAAALVWLLLHVREPERALLVVLGVAQPVLPLAYRGARSPLVRGLGAAGAVLLGHAFLALRAGPVALGLPGSRDPVAAADALIHAVPMSTAVEALILGLAAVALPFAFRRGLWALAAWGALVVAAALLPLDSTTLVATAWLTCGALATRT